MSLFSFDSPFLGVTQGIFGLLQASQGSMLQQDATSLQAQGFRSASTSAQGAANFNAQITEMNNKIQADALSRQISRIGSAQRSAAANTGLAVSSKSFLATMGNTLSEFESTALQQKVANENEKRATEFEVSSQRAALEQQARSSEFRGSIASFRSEKQQIKNLTSVTTQGISLLGGLL